MLLVPVAFAADAGDVVVKNVQGDVRVTVRGAERAARKDSVLELPAHVRTGNSSSVELRQGKTSVEAAANTHLEIPAPAVRGSPVERVIQSKGNAFYDVAKREAKKLRVETPYLVAVVKGTQFNVAVQDDSTTISLFEGRLEIHSSDDTDVVTLEPGQIATRRGTEQRIRVLRMDTGRPVARAGDGIDVNSPVAGDVAQSDALVASDRNGAGELSDSRVDGAGTTTVVDTENVRSAVEPNLASAEVRTPGSPVDTRVSIQSAGVDVSASVGSTSVSADVGAGLGSGGASIDAGVGASVGSAASVDLGTGVNVDAGGASVAANVGANVGGTTSVDLGASADVGAGATSVAVNTGVDLGSTTTSITTTTSADLGTGTTNLATTVSTPVTDVSAGASVSPTSGVNTSVSVGPISADLGVNLGTGTIDLGLGSSSSTSTSSSTTPTTTGTGTSTGGATGDGSVVGGLLGAIKGQRRRP